MFFVVLAVLFVFSFAYSVYLTVVNQPWAYFDTRTRVWEFTVGGLLMLIIFKVKLPVVISTIFGWVGLAGLVSTGLVLEVETSFPGYVALWPITSAVLIMIAGQNPSAIGVEKFLGSRPMMKLGGLSYGLYLWHWPLLAFYYIIFDTHDVSLIHGVLIILISLLLSYITTKFIERPIGAFISNRKYSLKAFMPIISMAIVLLIGIGGWFGSNQYQSSLAEQFTGDPNYPGVMASTEAYEDLEDIEPIPNLGSLKDSVADSCQVGPDVSEAEICEYGETENYDYTIAVVGGSKATHWLPSFQTFSEEDSIRVLNVTKSGCRFSHNPGNDGRVQDCIDWNEGVVDVLAEESPDLVFALADIGRADETEVPEGFINQFERLNEKGIEVMAVRDTPYFKNNVAECLAQNGVDSDECNVDRSYTVPHDAAWDKLKDPPENVHYVDYTDYICNEEECPAVIGNVIAYRDTDHMSATFNETFAPLVRQDVLSILPGESPSVEVYPANTVHERRNSSETVDETTEESEVETKEATENNLINLDKVEEGEWIDNEGDTVSRDHMMLTESIPYNPEDEYILFSGAYVSYFKGDEFIETILMVDGLPDAIETIEDADNIRLSFNKDLANETLLIGQGTSDNKNNLINFNTLEEGVWIYNEGDIIEGEQMMLTESIPYDPNQDYTLYSGAYISYFNGEQFMETILLTDNLPTTIERVEGADNIRLSFNRELRDEVKLIEE